MGLWAKMGWSKLDFIYPHRKGKRPITQQFSPSRLCGGDRHPGDHATNFKLPSWQSFSHNIGTIVICMNLFKFKQLRIQHISNLMVSHINVFRPTMERRFLAKMYSTLTVTIKHIPLLSTTKFPKNLFIQSNSLQASTTAISSASVVDRATHFFAT